MNQIRVVTSSKRTADIHRRLIHRCSALSSSTSSSALSSIEGFLRTNHNCGTNQQRKNDLLKYQSNLLNNHRCNVGLLESNFIQQQSWTNRMLMGRHQQHVRYFASAAPNEINDDTDDITSTSSTNNNFQLLRRTKIRNIAVIAHVDHGKTTLVDQLLKASTNHEHSNITERLMDSGDLEKERGITITGKVTRMIYKSKSNDDDDVIVINCADTPGHSDFSGEVDRFLSLSDGFVLVVDAAEGPKTQTKYVLTRALKLGLKPIVVLNKCDRPSAAIKIDSGETEKKLYELFNLLSDGNYTSEFTTLYASAREGWITDDPLQALEFADSGYDSKIHTENSMKKLLEYIVKEIPEPIVQCYSDEHNESSELAAKNDVYFANDKFSMAAVTVGNDTYLGRTCTGRILSGSIGINESVTLIRRKSDTSEENNDNKNSSKNTTFAPASSISGLFMFEGISRVPLKSDRAYAGDVITLAGVPDSIAVGDTITSTNNPVPEPIDTPPLAPPTLCMDFGANDGPLTGREGKQVSSAKIRARLITETDNNVTLKVEPSLTDSEKTIVYARGELQLGILIEQMRREGFEMVISPPRIITRKCPDTGKVLEPYEEVTVDVDSEYTGAVISSLTGDRRGTLIEMSEASDGKSQLILEVPSRGLLGFSAEIATATKGSAVVNHLYLDDRVQTPLGSGLIKGKLISTDTGKATGYALSSIIARGTLMVEPGDDVYSGMVIGEHTKPGDLEVNPVRSKEKTNIRSVNKEEKVTLPPPKKLSVEELIGYMESDEVIEITPKNVRLRKLLLDGGERERAARLKSKQLRSEKEKQK